MKFCSIAAAALLAAGMVVVGSCSRHIPTGARVASCCATNAQSPAAFTDKSIYQTESVWTTDAGTRVKLGSLRGRSQVVVMFFASCQYACPLLVRDLKQIEAALSPEAAAKTGFLLVTFDTEHDTPSALLAYRVRQQLSPARYTLLRGSPDDTLELAALLGVKYKKTADGQFAHSNLITVLNSEGEIVYQQAGLGQEPTLTAKAIELSHSQPLAARSAAITN